MSQRDDDITLHQIRDAARKILVLTSERSRAELDSDWIVPLALMQLLQIIGEATRRLSEGFRSRHAEVPWARIVSLRNRLIHGYDTIDHDRLWIVATDDVPALVRALDQILGSSERS
jgi:uncharacterized protein with HEPN domain